MIDNLALLIAHGLMMVAAIRLMSRPDLDVEPAPGESARTSTARWGRPPRA